MLKRGSWISGLPRYLSVIVVINLAWEFLHMPLYQLWETGSAAEIALAAIHCTGGDLLIALGSILAALIILGNRDWPNSQGWPLVLTTVVFGLVYTGFSEWLNIEIRGTWAYRDAMPIIPGINMGLSPALQWIVAPLASFWWTTYE